MSEMKKQNNFVMRVIGYFLSVFCFDWMKLQPS